MGQCAVTALLTIVTWVGLSRGDEPYTAGIRLSPDVTSVTILVESVQRESNRSGAPKYGLTRNDFHRIVNTIPGIRQAVPTREMSKPARYRDRLEDVHLVGTTPAFSEIRRIHVERGRFLIDNDVKRFGNVAVIGHTVAQRLFPGMDPIGKSVGVEGAYYLVVGVMAKGDGPKRQTTANVRGTPDRDVYIPLTTMRTRLGDLEITQSSGTFDADHCELSRILITVAEVAHANEVIETIARLLQKSHEQQDYTITYVTK
ncbi:MAG TPA: ABC transporter permease [Thermoguttaceae bacterium]|nr:ABC transporter permease [Thermoguttaceae bacterium]